MISFSTLATRRSWYRLVCIAFCLAHQVFTAAASTPDSIADNGQEGECTFNDATSTSYSAFENVGWAVTSQTVRYSYHQDLYDRYLNECQKYDHCHQGEVFRLYRNTHQPPSIYNYTTTGFAKMPAPPPVWKLLHDFWLENKHAQVRENSELNTPSNFLFQSSPDIVSLLNRTLGGTKALRQRIWQAARPVLEEWSGQRLAPSSVYGIRVYNRHAMLHPHVDRTNLVLSAIINIEQNVDEPWPLEIYDHQGMAHNITLEPGEMVLYESASCIHGRPYPLQGSFYANAFLHFETIGPLNDIKKCGSHADGLPPYIVPNSDWVEDWRKRNPRGWTLLHPFKAVVAGDLRTLELLAHTHPNLLLDKDDNGWAPIHEAARHAHDNTEILILLLNHGASVWERTGFDDKNPGSLPVDLAADFLGANHPTTTYLRSRMEP